ncbi:enhancer of split mdelta protein-like [Haliotis asinina]|uniref:enhancer of split mdelta protein-like n=1 Tax=Haliotis asinina TaxID=109174 RepID=UPI0035317F0D
MDAHRRESLTRKHLAERRRRAKINYYLDEIEALISPPATKGTPVKMEKAELLEKTVAYLRALRSNGVDFRHFRQLPHRLNVYSPYTIPPMTSRTSRQDNVATDRVTDVIQPLNLKTQTNDDVKEHNSVTTPEDLKAETQERKPLTDNSKAELNLFTAVKAECNGDLRVCDSSVEENMISNLLVKQERTTDLSLYELEQSHLGNIVWRPWKGIV